MKIHPLSFILCSLVFSTCILEIQGSFWDAVPVVSQVKSFIQYLGGDSDAAAATQHNFLYNSIIPLGPIIKSSIDATKGDTVSVAKTWRHYGNILIGAMDSVPLVGHVKGIYHYANGETQKGHQSMKSATRPLLVITGGIGGTILGGPVGGFAGGLAAGVTMDGLITGIESAVNGNYTPHGHINSLTKIVQGKATMGGSIDTVLNVLGDGILGYASGALAPGLVPCRRKRRKRGVGWICSSATALTEVAPTIAKYSAGKLIEGAPVVLKVFDQSNSKDNPSNPVNNEVTITQKPTFSATPRQINNKTLTGPAKPNSTNTPPSVSFWDTVPLISQTKSFIEYLRGDSAAAKTTQDNFLRKNLIPLVPIIRSSIEAIKGDEMGARETWKQYGNAWGDTIESIPVLGHAKAAVHYIAGDTERGNQVIKSSTRPLGVIAGGIGGAVAGGPVGAIAGGIAGGATYDGIVTGVESVVRNEYTPSGHVDLFGKIFQGNASKTDYGITALTVVEDGIGGLLAGKPFGKPAKTTNLVPCRRRRRKRQFRSCGVYSGLARQSSDPLPFKPSSGDLPPRINSISSFKSTHIVQPIAINPSAVLPSLGKVATVPSKVVFPVIAAVIPSVPTVDFKTDIFAEITTNNPLIKQLSRGREKSPTIVLPPLKKIDVTQPIVKLPVVAVSTNSAHANEANSKEEKENKEKKQCSTQPDIKNRDTGAMRNCEGTSTGESCNVKCLRGFHPNSEEAMCILEGNIARWNSDPILCRVAVVCRNEMNEPTDWFVVYKLAGSLGLNRNIEYLFLTSESTRDTGNAFERNPDPDLQEFYNDWQPGDHFYNFETNPVYNTLQTILNQGDQNPYIMYSDQPPTGGNYAGFGHAKGVLGFDNRTGFYMPHSWPNLPDALGRGGSDRYGQLFMCFSFHRMQQSFEHLLEYVFRLRPKVYWPQRLHPALDRFTRPQWSQHLIPYIVDIPSIGGEMFRFFAKPYMPDGPRTRGTDIYRFIISPHYGVDMYVLSWRHGRAINLESVCEGVTVEDIFHLEVDHRLTTLDRGYEWGNQLEHSKWAVSNPWVRNRFFCIGDTNRQDSQEGRYGGAVCMHNEHVIEAFFSLIRSTECRNDIFG